MRTALSWSTRPMLAIGLLAAAASLVTGCASTPEPVGVNPNYPVARLEALPAPGPRDTIATGRSYLIGPFDKLRVEVYGVPELQRDVQTDGEGAFNFPFVGTVNAAGLTLEQAQTLVDRGLRGRYVRRPNVTVNLLETGTQRVALDGQVARPGLYPVVGRLTLVRAIANAGGMSEYAKGDDVVVFRTVNGTSYAGLYDVNAIRRGNYRDPEIYANDVIVIGDDKQRRLFRDLLQASPLLTTPLIILAQRL